LITLNPEFFIAPNPPSIWQIFLKPISFKDLVGTGKKEINFSEVDVEKAKDYAAEDADITFRLYKKFQKSLKDEKMINIYEIFEKPLLKILAYMEIEGVKIDNNFLNFSFHPKTCIVNLFKFFSSTFCLFIKIPSLSMKPNIFSSFNILSP